MSIFDWFRKTPEPEKPPARRRRDFKAGRVDRLNFGFATIPSPLDYDLKTQLYPLTTRARWLAKNDDYVRRYLKVAKNNIVGPRGIELRANYEKNGSPHKSAIDAVEAAWKDWSRCGVTDVTGRLSWVDCQNMAVEHLARDGEVLVLKQPMGPYGLQLQFLDPLTLGVRYNEILSDDREVVMGVEIDRRYRRPLAYHFVVHESNQPDTTFFEGRRYRRVPADRVLHLYRQEEVFQTRGYSPLASAIQRLKMLNGYEEAALTAARAGASKMGFYKETGDQFYEGDVEDEDGQIIDEFEAGTMTRLPQGIEVEAFDTGWPNVNHGEYVKAVLRGIASGIGVSYNTLANDLEGVNFSSIRSGTLEDREEWKAAQAWISEKFCQPIFEEWLERALVLGRIQSGGGSPFGAERFNEFRRVTWQGRRWDWVDPLKDIQANSQAINYRLRSISDVIRERGQDPDDVFAEIQREREKLSEMGIELEVMGNDGDSLQGTVPGDAGGE